MEEEEEENTHAKQRVFFGLFFRLFFVVFGQTPAKIVSFPLFECDPKTKRDCLGYRLFFKNKNVGPASWTLNDKKATKTDLFFYYVCDEKKQAMAKMPQQQQVVSQKAEQLSKSVAAATTAFAAPAFAANESISDVALANVNILGVIAVALFILIPVSFLVILYVKSAAEGNVSGGFSQSYYDDSKRQGKKLANEAAAIKGAGLGMRPKN